MKARGFTLIEVLTAVALLAGLMAVASLSWSGNFRRLRKSENRNIINRLLEQKMAELEAKYKNENINTLPSEDKGEFFEEPNYKWQYKTQPLALPDTLTWLAAQGLPQDERNISLTEALKNILSSTVVEVQLTVQLKKTEKGYSLTTYFVNYDSVPGLVGAILGQFSGQEEKEE